jgi:drug/metabolite transporter (DMT)-like permease
MVTTRPQRARDVLGRRELDRDRDPVTTRSEQASRTTGVVIVVVGVLVLSPESLVIRLIDADQWTILSWRGVLMAIGLMTFVSLNTRLPLRRQIAGIGSAGLLAAVLFASDNVLFVTSLTLTAVANTLLILSSAPLFAAVFAAIFLGERVPRRTWATIAIAAFAVAIIVSDGLDRRALGGDLAALGAAMCIAGTFVVLRGARSRNMLPSMALGALLGALVAAPFADVTAVRGDDIALLLLLGLVIAPVAFGLLSVGPRYLPAAEVSLVILAEAVLGPLWVWVALGERPGPRVVTGGVILLGALALHYGREVMANRRPAGSEALGPGPADGPTSTM